MIEYMTSKIVPLASENTSKIVPVTSENTSNQFKSANCNIHLPNKNIYRNTSKLKDQIKQKKRGERLWYGSGKNLKRQTYTTLSR